MSAVMWYDDWQHQQHAVAFDGCRRLDRRNLVRWQEGLNDVRLLNERVTRDRTLSLLEVGCATGELYRYLRIRYPRVRYYGLDISRVAIARAKQKYPEAAYFVNDPTTPIDATLQACGIPAHPELVYAKDVLHHQTEPLAFLSQLIQIAGEAVVVRCRTRDAGPTEWDPERSCQYHYDGWMPYLVVNLQELLDHVMAEAPEAEVVVYRNHTVLGGKYNRFLPKELFLPSTGTAETALGMFRRTEHPGRVTIADRVDKNSGCTWDAALRHAVRQALGALRLCMARDAGPQVVAQVQWSQHASAATHTSSPRREAEIVAQPHGGSLN